MNDALDAAAKLLSYVQYYSSVLFTVCIKHFSALFVSFFPDSHNMSFIEIQAI